MSNEKHASFIDRIDFRNTATDKERFDYVEALIRGALVLLPEGASSVHAAKVNGSWVMHFTQRTPKK